MTIKNADHMNRFTLIPHCDSAPVVIPASILEAVSLRIGDVIEASFGKWQMLIHPADEIPRHKKPQHLAEDMLARRADAYQRLA